MKYKNNRLVTLFVYSQSKRKHKISLVGKLNIRSIWSKPKLLRLLKIMGVLRTGNH